MTEEWNLSDKISAIGVEDEDDIEIIRVSDIKEFIRRLIEIIDSQEKTDLDFCVWLKSWIRRLAGSKLVEEGK